MQNATFLGPFCALMASVTWAVGSAGYSRLSRGHSPFAVNFGRATVALPLFVLGAVILNGGPGQALHAYASVSRIELFWLAVSIFASYGLGDVFFMWSTRSLGVPAALAIGSTYPILTAGLAALLQGETLRPAQVAGLLLTVAGVITVILSQAEPTPASSEGAYAAPHHLTRKSVGVTLAFGTMLMWALNSVGTAKGAKNIDPFLGNSFRMVFALGMSAGFGRVLAPGTEIALPKSVLRRSLPLLIFEAFGGSLFFMYGLSHSPLAIGSTLASLAPVLSVPVAWFFGLERFSVRRTLGVCGVVCGIWLLLGVF
jgi:drug/metabolite transporter (DMT)-like permease